MAAARNFVAHATKFSAHGPLVASVFATVFASTFLNYRVIAHVIGALLRLARSALGKPSA